MQQQQIGFLLNKLSQYGVFFGWMGGTLGQPTDTVSSVVQKSVLKTPICLQREQS